MKKRVCVLLAALCAFCAAGAFAGEAARIGSFSQSYVLKNFEKVSTVDGRIQGVSRYDDEVYGYTADDQEYNIFSGLSGNDAAIDMTTELVAAAAVLNIHPVEPADALKAYVEIAMEGAVNQFLGVTGTTHSEVLARLQSKYNYSQSQINSAIKQSVSETVDTEFKKTRGGYVPFDVYANAGHGAVITSIKDILTAFFLNPNNTTYSAVWAVLDHYGNQIRQGSNFASYAGEAFFQTVVSLNPELARKIDTDKLTIPATVNNDPDVRTIRETVVSIR
jgi:hypothetical protein